MTEEMFRYEYRSKEELEKMKIEADKKNKKRKTIKTIIALLIIVGLAALYFPFGDSTSEEESPEYKEAYSEGYNDGYNEAYNQHDEIYEDGYNEGWHDARIEAVDLLLNYGHEEAADIVDGTL